MIDPKYLQFGKDAVERVHKYSEKLYMAFYKGKILDVGKTGYKRRGDLILALSKIFMSEVYQDISTVSGGYKPENWRIAQGRCKEVVEEIIKDNIIEIRYI